MGSNVGGIQSEHVIDSTKIVCPRCNGTHFQLSSLLADPNAITRDLEFAALDITFPSGKSCQGLVAVCLHCGNEFVPLWYLLDIGAALTGALTMTNLVTGTADTLVNCYLIYVGDDANDKGKYFTITSHTGADPCVFTPCTTLNDLSDGFWILTNILPFGFTLAT